MAKIILTFTTATIFLVAGTVITGFFLTCREMTKKCDDLKKLALSMKKGR